MNLTRVAVVGAAAALFFCPPAAHGQSSSWTDNQPLLNGTGPFLSWDNAGSWAGGTIASGASNTATFNLAPADPAGFYAIELPTARTIGNLTFGDSNTATPTVWTVFAASANVPTSILTLDNGASSPVLNSTVTGNVDVELDPVGAPGALTTFSGARLTGNIAGTNGFTKTGAGILALAGPGFDNNATPTTFEVPMALTGVINVNEGTLRLDAGTFLDFETTLTPGTVSAINLASGATLTANAFARNINAASGSTINSATGNIGGNAAGATGVDIADGGTLTINRTGTASLLFANVSGAGATLNLNAQTGTTSMDRDWAQNGALANLNLTGTVVGTPSPFRLRNNGGTFNANSFATTNVNLTNALVFTNTNSGGNTNTFGALSGDSTSTLQGGAAGSVATYAIGGLNTSTTFAGNVTQGNGLNLFKVGTGTLTLSGVLSYQTTNNATANRRGGVTRVEAGTLALTNSAAIPGGIVDGTLGDLFTTVDVRQGATLDVSGYTSGTYATAALQQLIGRGTINGNYNHAAGILAPGDANVGGNTAALTATAGTLTFDDTLSFSGTGQVNFDISPSLASGNDLLQVGGANLNGAPTLKVGFLGGATTGAYTVINSATPLVGSTAGWNVLWEGRGAAPTLTQTANQVQLNVTAGNAGTLNWSGAVDGVWNAGAAGTSNWQNVTGGTPGVNDKFFQLDTVRFLDTFNGVTAPTNTTVTLNSTVAPNAVTVNSALAYTISGTGRITGGASLTKQGTGTLTLSTNNDFSGGATLAQGIVDIGAAGTVGTGHITLSGGELRSVGRTFDNTISTTPATTSILSNSHETNGLLLLNGAISGSGALQVQNTSVSAAINGVDFGGNNSGFTGSLSITGAAPVFFRARQATSLGNGIALDVGNNGSTVGTVIGADATIPLGSLTGGAASTLRGHSSGAGAGVTTYEIGSLNTSTTFDGTITNGSVEFNPISVTHVTKVGTGSLTLGGTLSYTGHTTVEGGTLTIVNPDVVNGTPADVNTFNDLTTFTIDTDAFLNLTYTGTDEINFLYFGGTPQAPGVYSSANSGGRITGTGTLTVAAMGPPLTLAGDYNADGVVNAADYVVWRDGDSPDSSEAGYTTWVSNFGASGAGASLDGAAAPEPAAAALVGLVLAAAATRRRR